MIKSAGLVIIKNNKILLVKPGNINNDHNWSIPKGIIDSSQNETIVQTAVRETFEETGLLIPFNRIDRSKRSIISYVDSKGLLTKIIFYFVLEISDEEFHKYKITETFDRSEIESFEFLSFRDATRKIYWKQASVLNFLKPDMLCLSELEQLIRLNFIYRVKHPVFPLWMYNITRKCKAFKNWNYTTLSCRGIILDDSGKIIARPFKKFFEKKHIHKEILDLLPEQKIITKKLDGALGIMYSYKNNFYISCKNHFNHYSGTIATDAFYNNHYWFEVPEMKTYTVLFEIISSKVPFTVNYNIGDTISPIGILDNTTAKNNFSILNHFKKQSFDDENSLSEGFVEFFEDGTAVKHKAKEFMDEYQHLKKMKEKMFHHSKDRVFNLLNRKKLIEHSATNTLKNLSDFFNGNAESYNDQLNYWV